jgi:DsbC/DsbD-like thiol-disulfide interchange protein/cytochrome c biogenesis protein CcdA
MNSRFTVLFLWSFSFASAVGFADSARVANLPHGNVELLSKYDGSPRTGLMKLGLHFQLERGWHIYWKNPGDSGQAPRIHWTSPAGMNAGELDWPAPDRLTAGPLVDFGYEGDVLLPISLRLPAGALNAKPLVLRGEVRALVCREVCIPGRAQVSLLLPVGSGAPAANPEVAALFSRAESSLPVNMPSSWRPSATQTGDQILLKISGTSLPSSAVFFPGSAGQVEDAATQRSEQRGADFRLSLVRPRDAKGPLGTIEGILRLPPGSSPAAYLVRAEVSQETPAPGGTGPSPDNLLVMTLFAFAGGLILNLMPCVFPVLSLKAVSLLKAADQGDLGIRRNALIYVAGVFVSFYSLVGLLLILRAGGNTLGWGFQLQSPGFVAFLACLLFAMGLNLAGVFEVGQSILGIGGSLTQSGGWTASFFTGVLATVVATPCTAPFMGAAVGFALSQPIASCLLIFSSMALGLSAPFLLLAYMPAWGRFLPKPGRWMETLKQALAFPVFATVIWLLWVFGSQAGLDGFTRLLSALLIIAFAVWVMRRWSTKTSVAVAAILVLGGFYYAVLASSGRLAADEKGTRGLTWEAFTAAKLSEYRAAGTPVLIDFTAAWCLTCQVNERVAFQSAEVQDRLRRARIRLLRADWTSYDAEVTRQLSAYGRAGVPLYVLYGKTGDPVVLPDGLLKAGTVVRALNRLKL